MPSKIELPRPLAHPSYMHPTLVEQTMGMDDLNDQDTVLLRAVPSLAKLEASSPTAMPHTSRPD
jgi:hypothetical protein